MASQEPQLTPNAIDALFDDDDTFNGVQTDAEGRFNMKVEQSGQNKGSVLVSPSTTVGKLKQMIQDRITGSENEVSFTTPGLSDNSKTLKECGSPKGHDDANTVQLKYKADGGAAARRKRCINFQRFRDLKEAPSHATDCMLKVRIPGEKYAMMSCGCAI